MNYRRNCQPCDIKKGKRPLGGLKVKSRLPGEDNSQVGGPAQDNRNTKELENREEKRWKIFNIFQAKVNLDCRMVLGGQNRGLLHEKKRNYSSTNPKS